MKCTYCDQDITVGEETDEHVIPVGLASIEPTNVAERFSEINDQTTLPLRYVLGWFVHGGDRSGDPRTGPAFG